MPMTPTDIIFTKMVVNVPEMVHTFRRAAEVIRIGGLTKNAYEDDTRHCAIGALMAARGVSMWNVTSVWPEVSYLVDLLGGSGVSRPNTVVPGSDMVADWNDRADRTADDVITLLEQAAEKLEADL